MALKKFTRTKKRIIGRPTIRITDKTFVLNVECVQSFFEEKGFVDLYFDSEDIVIGLRPSASEKEDSYIVKKYRAESPTGIISATDFIRHFSIMDIVHQLDKKTFPVETDSEGMLIVRLK